MSKFIEQLLRVLGGEIRFVDDVERCDGKMLEVPAAMTLWIDFGSRSDSDHAADCVVDFQN